VIRLLFDNQFFAPLQGTLPMAPEKFPRLRCHPAVTPSRHITNLT